ncbi:MAG: prepilin-type N-terminal cleavage/methylation domain-containing protein [Deltaproteobacteria bacterium]
MALQTNSKGFTLIEVLITLIILAVSLLALAGLMATTTKSNASGGHITEASTLAQDRLEELRAVQWDNIPVGAVSDQRNGSTGINYVRNLNVQQNGNLKTATLTINWMDRTSHSIRLLSVMAQ